MGVGMIVITDKNDADKALNILKENGENPYIIGEIKNGEKGVKLI